MHIIGIRGANFQFALQLFASGAQRVNVIGMNEANWKFALPVVESGA